MAKSDLSGVGKHTSPLAERCKDRQHRAQTQGRVNNAVFPVAVSAVAGVLHSNQRFEMNVASINVEGMPIN